MYTVAIIGLTVLLLLPPWGLSVLLAYAHEDNHDHPIVTILFIITGLEVLIGTIAFLAWAITTIRFTVN